MNDVSSGSSGQPVADPVDIRTLFLKKITEHPLAQFEETYFLDLLEYSLSLSVFEKKRVIDAVPTLSQFQVNELIKVFEDEREEFKKLMPKEGDTIRDLISKAKIGWIQLYDTYLQEDMQNIHAQEDQQKIDDLKKNLGI